MEKASYYVAPETESQLMKREEIKRLADQDNVYIISGAEGSGKSLFGAQLACRTDKNFSLKDVCFTSDEFAKRIREKERYGAVIFDEANNGLSSKGAISKENKKLIKLLQECRQRNLTIFIILPSVFLLEKYVVLFRSQALFHVAIYKKDYKKRYYKVYNRKNLKLLFMLGQKFMSYAKPKLHKKYRFYENYPLQIDEKEYRQKKLAAFREGENRQDQESKFKVQRDLLIAMFFEHTKFKAPKLSEWLKSVGEPLAPEYLRKIALQRRNRTKISG